MQDLALECKRLTEGEMYCVEPPKFISGSKLVSLLRCLCNWLYCFMFGCKSCF